LADESTLNPNRPERPSLERLADAEEECAPAFPGAAVEL
jgi:hypothetical protein